LFITTIKLSSYAYKYRNEAVI